MFRNDERVEKLKVELHAAKVVTLKEESDLLRKKIGRLYKETIIDDGNGTVHKFPKDLKEDLQKWEDVLNDVRGLLGVCHTLGNVSQQYGFDEHEHKCVHELLGDLMSWASIPPLLIGIAIEKCKVELLQLLT